MAIQTTFHDDILQHNVPRPAKIAMIDDPLVQAGGDLWRGDFAPSDSLTIQLLALTSPAGWLEVTWSDPTDTVGVQFCGDSNDGWARILVDGEVLWTGNTYHAEGKFRQYVALGGLPLQPHHVRVEATGQAGAEGGGAHVTVTALGWGAVSAEHQDGDDGKIFLPFISS